MLKRVLPFILTLLVGVTLGSFWNLITTRPSNAPRVSPVGPLTYSYGDGSACASRRRSFHSAPLSILYEPNTRLTSAARRNKTTGVVRLRVMFGADGETSVVERIKTLPDGLTEEAERAVEQIRFVPASERGRPVTTTKEVDFIFSLDRY